MKKAFIIAALLVPSTAMAEEPCPKHTPLHFAASETTKVVKGTGLFFKGVLIDVHDGAVEVVDFAHDGVVDTVEFAHRGVVGTAKVVHGGVVTVAGRGAGAASEVVGGYGRALGRLFPLPTCRCKDCRRSRTTVRTFELRRAPAAPLKRTLLP